MKYLFWPSVVLVWYTYAGYPLLLLIISRLRPRPVMKARVEPTVSIVLAVHNEAKRLAAKLENLRRLNYPADLVQIIVVSDGSTDGTSDLLRSLDGILPVILTNNAGKAVALNAAIEVARGDIVIFTDARQEIEPSALRQLLANFSDNAVGCVSGELLFRDASGLGEESGVSVYWRFEKLIRKLEAATGSVVGATGAFYAARRELVPTVPEGTLLDDVFIPLAVARAGFRVVFEGSARAWDEEPQAGKHEFRRKVRTLAGNYQLLQFAPWLLSSENPLRFRFWSHKLLRLVVPFVLIIVLVTSCILWNDGLYRVFAILQLIFYGFAITGLAVKKKVPMASAPASFCLLNAAAAAALIKFLRYRHSPTLLWKGRTAEIKSGGLAYSSTTLGGETGKKEMA